MDKRKSKKGLSDSQIVKVVDDIEASKFVKPKEIVFKHKLKVEDQDFKELLKDLDIDEFFTKFDDKQSKYNRFVNSVVPLEDFNYMGDLLFLPTTSKKYKYLLVILDLATNEFDMEPLKSKFAHEVLDAYKTIIKRKIIVIPKISFRTDNGTEFKGSFTEFLKLKKVFHKNSFPYNHKQTSPIEGLNSLISRIINNYLNKKTMILKKQYYEWTDILNDIRINLNLERKRDLKKLKLYQRKFYFSSFQAGAPIYKIGDIVHYRLFKPEDINGNTINDGKFRQGDRRLSIDAREIVDILYYPDEPHYRYLLKHINNVSFSEYDLKLSANKENTYKVKKLIDKKVENKKTYYLVWFQGYLKKQSTWEPKDRLIEDGLLDYINLYEKEKKTKK